MKRNDRLFQLIKSLSKSEKRFFKIYSNRHVIGEGNKYVRLFDVIERQKKYDEKFVIQRFKNEKFIKRISVAKGYLYDLILKSMNAYHAQNSITGQLRELLGNISFLYEKSIYAQALKVVKKTKKLAEEHEQLSFLPEILRWQKKLLETAFFTKNAAKDIVEIHEQTTQALDKLHNINAYWHLHAQLYYHNSQKGIVQNRKEIATIDELFQNELVQDETKAATYQSRLLRYKIWATYHFINRNVKDCYAYSKKMIELLETRPEVLDADALDYITAVNNLLNMTAMLQKDEEREHYLERLRSMLHDTRRYSSERLQIKLFEAYYYHLMTLAVSKGTFKKGLEAVADMQAGLEKYSGKVDAVGEIMLYFYSFHICFGAAVYKEAYSYLQRIIHSSHNDIRKDIFYFAQILSLLTAYQLGDAPLLKKHILSLYRFLHQKSQFPALEAIIIDYLKQLKNVSDESQFKASLLPLKESLVALSKAQSPERRAFAYFDFVSWVHSESIGEPFAEVIFE